MSSAIQCRMKLFVVLVSLAIIFQTHCNSILNDENFNSIFSIEDVQFEGHKKPLHDGDYEIIDLPARLWSDDSESENLILQFIAFGHPIEFNFKTNNKLVMPNTRIVKRRSGNEVEIISGPNNRNCHFLHMDNRSSAAVSNCFENEINGIFMLPNATLEIQPVTEHLQSFLNLPEPLIDASGEKSYPHIVKRALKLTDSVFKDDISRRESVLMEDNFDKIYKRATKDRKPTIEVGVFFDEAGYDIFAPYFDYHDHKLRDMILAYMNGVQALYHHPSLGTPIDITIVYLEIMESQPREMPHYDGDRNRLLDSFCEYQENINPKGDKHPGHWDMALYISGLDFFAYENGRKNGVTMGLATVGGVCIAQYACIIAEFGTTNIFGKPYPSAGFTSVYIMAHEIGHNLGMHHDSSGNSCSKEGFVMSPSRGTHGETTWSSCSADTVSNLNWARCLFDKPTGVSPDNDAWKYFGFPGQMWTAKQQCEILLVDNDAYVSSSRGGELICQNLQCRTTKRTGYYSAGPALDGTLCGAEKWCNAGSCVHKSALPKPVQVVKGGWSDWTSEKCISGCTLRSKGFQERTRTCDNPRPQNTDEGCVGSSYDVAICDDSEFCRKTKRKSTIEFASKRCQSYSMSIPEIDSSGKGLQAPHETNRLWMACAIFCRREDTGAYYTPRVELNDLQIDAYFLDGTWCHNDGRKNYYCMRHHCLPENYQQGKATKDIWELGEDIPIPGNAISYPEEFLEKLKKYLSIDENGRPLLTHFEDKDIDLFLKEGHWPNDDYLEMPENRERHVESDKVYNM